MLNNFIIKNNQYWYIGAHDIVIEIRLGAFMQNVAVLGASKNPERYSYQAIELLQKYGHQVFPVNPAESEILGHPVTKSLDDLSIPIDTLSIYVRPEIGNQFETQMIKLKPKRIIFNPGTENPVLSQKLESLGIECLEACTLVMLRTNQFD